MSRRAHVLAIPFPVQGHVRPFIKLSNQIADQGMKVTLVIGESVHSQVVALFPGKGEQQKLIEMVSIPDGREIGYRFMPGHLEDLIRKINSSDDNEKITCVIADATVGWALEVADKFGIKRAMFWLSSSLGFLMILHIPKLIEDGVIDSNGAATKKEMIRLAPNLPTISSAEFLWSFPSDPILEKALFERVFAIFKNIKFANWQLCNSFHELEPSAFSLTPDLITIGPLLSSNRLGQPSGSFWPEDSTCLDWLNKQPARSVIYVAFGSTTNFGQHQFVELALGLELVAQPFLWVVRQEPDGAIQKYPNGFTERVANYGKIVDWAPQENVLAHPSIACFFTHCGYNSVMEGLSMGVPFLCLPYFSDQLHMKTYICDVWKVGLGLNPDENGTISRHEIKTKMEELLSDGGIQANSLKLKEKARESIREGGSSSKNFKKFIGQIK